MNCIKNRISIIVTILFCITIFAQESTVDIKVFELLDLELASLKKVKVAVDKGSYDKAAIELLIYYRNRMHIKHPEVNSNEKQSWLGKKISATNQEKANKGMEHLFFIHKGYGYLDYGKDIDWDFWPIKDNEIRWQVNRMYWWIPMGEMYWATGDEKYAKEWIFQFRDWVNDNPLGLSKENDRFAWRPLETSRRLQDQTTMFNFFLNSKHFTPQFLIEFLKNYYIQAERVSANYTKIGNHRLFQAQRMIYAGGFFQEFKNARRWRKEGVDILTKEMEIQVLDDGFHFEMSQHYHLGAIETFLRGLQMAQLCNLEGEFSEEYLQTIKKMIYANLNVSFPDLTYPMFGDAWKTTTKGLTKKFKEWHAIFPEDQIIKYYATKGKFGEKPRFLSERLSTTGFTSFRNGWGMQSTALIMRAGIAGGWFHTQPDNGTFELWYKGVNLMPDAGCYVYGGEKEILDMRNWYRQSSIHQTLTLNDEDILVDGKKLKWEVSENLDYIVYENLSYKDLKHRRSVFFVDKTFFVIVDEAIGNATGEIKVRNQIKEGKAGYNFEQNKFWSNNSNQPNVLVSSFSNLPIKTIEEDLKISYYYRKEIQRKGVAFSIQKKDEKPVRMISIVYPFDNKIKPLNINCNFIEVSSDKVTLKLEMEGMVYNLGYNLSKGK